MDQVQVAWAGGGMGSGLTILYFADGTAAGHLQSVADLLTAYAGNAPDQVTMRVQGSGLQVGTDGKVIGSWSGTAPAMVRGQAPSASFAAGVGMRIRWFTQGINGGHKVRGSTFLVPLATGAYQSDGSIGDAQVNAMQTAVNTFLTAVGSDFEIWSRPKPTKNVAGVAFGVSSGTVVDRVSWLRSRRT